MRSLAELIMKGRRQAILAAVVAGALPPISLLGPVVVALVTLRHGLREGLIVLVWALAPLVVWLLYSSVDLDRQNNLMSVFLLFGVTGLAQLLRATGPWQATALAVVGVSFAFEAYLTLQPAAIDGLIGLLESLQLQGESAGTQAVQEIERARLITGLAVFQGLLSVLLLIWARWLQAMLYNPGGFRAEFHALRIEYRSAVPLVAGLLLAGFGILPSLWYWHFLMPLLLAGVALVHATIALKLMSPILLFVFYMVLPAISQFVVLLALIDSWYDFRKRMRKPA